MPENPTPYKSVRRKRIGQNPYGPRAIATAIKRQKVMELRVQGLSYTKIGKVVGLTGTACHEHVKEAMKELNELFFEDTKQIRDTEVQRLDGMLEKLYPTRKDPRTSDTILRIMERRAKLLGLDAAAKSEVTVTGFENLTDEQLAEKVESILHSARERDSEQAVDGGPKKEGT